MGRPGFCDPNRGSEGLDGKNDPPVAIAGLVPSETFRGRSIAAPVADGGLTAEADRKSAAGRKAWD